MTRRDTEYSWSRRAKRETTAEHPTPVEGVRSPTLEMKAAIAAARLLDAIRLAAMDAPHRAELLVDVRLQLTPEEAHLVAGAIVAALAARAGSGVAGDDQSE